MRNGKPKGKTKIKVERSCGNVFRDLGLENPELLLAKSTLIVEIHRTMEELPLTDAAAAKVLGITPDDVDAVLRGDVEDRYSIRQLASMLHTLNEVGAERTDRAKMDKNSKIKRSSR
jgi:predicted XRE-type DNA-binding protein